MKKVLSSTTELEDLIAGATLLGVGGGGNPKNGLRLLNELLDAGKKPMIWTLDEFSENDQFASPYFVGSVAPGVESQKPAATVKDPMQVAFRILEEKLGKKISATVASEIGGGNTAASIAIATKMGIPTVDGDLMGRAGPELHQSTVHIFGVSMVPAGIASETGNEILIEKYANIDDYEAVARYSSVVSGGHVAVVDSPLTFAEAKKCVVPGTTSKAIELSGAVREATAQGKDPITTIAASLDNGKEIFEGVVSSYTWKDQKGFLFGESNLSGTGSFSGQKLKTTIMNEHIACWINDKPAVMPPDLIMFVNPKTGRGITNTELKEGMEVAVVASSINNVWRSPNGLKFFGPRRFSLNFDYVPFEKLNQ
jgi:uncharacterized protein